MDYEQVLLEVMQFTGYREDVKTAFFMNSGIYNETVKTRVTLRDNLLNTRKYLSHTNYDQQVYRKWYPNLKLKERIEFTNDNIHQHHGVTQYWYPDGKLKRIAHYKDNERYGNSISYYPNGAINEITPYRQNRIHGTHIRYNRDGTVYQTAQYYMGVPHGQHITRFPNSNIISTVIGFRMGKAEGPWITNYSNGQPRQSEHYVNGRLSGKYMLWYPNGVLEQEQTFLDGERHGEHIAYNEKGKQIEYAIFEYGRVIEETAINFKTDVMSLYDD